VTPPSWFARLLPQWFGSRSDERRIADARFAVVDVDVTGTSLRQDRVSGIAVLPVEAGAFRISDLRYCALDARGGRADPGTAASYAAVRAQVAGSPIVTYNPDFVRDMIRRSCRRKGLPPLDGEWIDLAAAASIVGGAENELATMDYWLRRMKTGGPRPHDAVWDVFSMAQLLQAIVAYAEDAGFVTVEALARSEDVRPWLRRGA